MGFWSFTAKALGGEDPVVSGLYLYFQGDRMARPFGGCSPADTGRRPCLFVKGLTDSEALKLVVGGSLNWDALPVHIMTKMDPQAGDGIVEVGVAEFRGLLK